MAVCLYARKVHPGGTARVGQGKRPTTSPFLVDVIRAALTAAVRYATAAPSGRRGLGDNDDVASLAAWPDLREC